MTISPLTNSFIPADFLKDTFLFVKLAIATGILQHKHSGSAILFTERSESQHSVFSVMASECTAGINTRTAAFTRDKHPILPMRGKLRITAQAVGFLIDKRIRAPDD